MSADTFAIAILVSRSEEEGGPAEFRAAYVQNVNRLFDTRDYPEGKGFFNRELALKLFGQVKPVYTMEDAWIQAEKIQAKLNYADCSTGIIDYPSVPFPKANDGELQAATSVDPASTEVAWVKAMAQLEKELDKH